MGQLLNRITEINIRQNAIRQQLRERNQLLQTTRRSATREALLDSIEQHKQKAATLEDELIEAQRALYVARADRKIAREKMLRELVGADPDTGFVYVEVAWANDRSSLGSRVVVGLYEQDENGNRIWERGTYMHGPLTGHEWCEPKKMFGLEVTVYGPSDNYFAGQSEATVSMGSVGAQPVSITRQLIDVHTMGLMIAMALNEHYAEWKAEDSAD